MVKKVVRVVKREVRKGKDESWVKGEAKEMEKEIRKIKPPVMHDS